jgi:hypothetical protein
MRLVVVVSWMPCFVDLAGVAMSRAALSSALTCRAKEGITAGERRLVARLEAEI